jgi:hypothetical protein
MDGITINVMVSPTEKTAPIGTYNTYEEAMTIAIQCRKTHPKEAVTIYPHGNSLYTVIRDVI